MSDINRYDNVPLSDKTRQGMSLNIDDLAAIGRLLTLQDDAYDERFEELEAKFDSLLSEIKELKEDINDLREEVKCLGKTVDHTKDEIAEIRLEVDRLKRSNNIWAYAMIIAVGVAAARGIVRWIHGPF